MSLLENEKIPQKQSIFYIVNQEGAGIFSCFGSRLVSGKYHEQKEPVASIWRKQRPKSAMFFLHFLYFKTLGASPPGN